jgi:hypothetical protein
MDLWAAIVLIVLISSIAGIVKSNNDRKRESGASEQQLTQISEQIGKLEKRIANVESIIFELEKDRSFSQLDQ